MPSRIWKADNGQSAWQRAKELLPDVAIIDVSMPEINGVQTAALLCPLLGSKSGRIVWLGTTAPLGFGDEPLASGVAEANGIELGI